jgi:hypothetical protein
MSDVSKFMNLNWHGIKDEKKVCRSAADISITKHASGYGIMFRNDTLKKLAVNGCNGRVCFAAFDKDTLCFKCDKDGFTVSQRNGKGTPTIRLKRESWEGAEDLKDTLENLVGDHKLNYEPHFKLYYISKGE